MRRLRDVLRDVLRDGPTFAPRTFAPKDSIERETLAKRNAPAIGDHDERARVRDGRKHRLGERAIHLGIQTPNASVR